MTLIAPAQGALELPEVAELFEYLSSYMPVPRKVSRLSSFRNVAKVFSEPLSNATGWVPEVSLNPLRFNLCRQGQKSSYTSLVKPSTPRLPWSFCSDYRSIQNLLETLSAPKIPLTHEKFGRILQGAWSKLSPKVLAEDACTRKVGLHHLTLFEGLDVTRKILQELAKPDF